MSRHVWNRPYKKIPTKVTMNDIRAPWPVISRKFDRCPLYETKAQEERDVTPTLFSQDVVPFKPKMNGCRGRWEIPEQISRGKARRGWWRAAYCIPVTRSAPTEFTMLNLLESSLLPLMSFENEEEEATWGVMWSAQWRAYSIYILYSIYTAEIAHRRHRIPSTIVYSRHKFPVPNWVSTIRGFHCI